MSYSLKNENLEIQLDHPLENYRFSRFDWSGKITQVKFKNIPLSISERTDDVDEHLLGKGFYNEFGIETPLGFEEAHLGGWFHKIGVGLLKKDSDTYNFNKSYIVHPADFVVESKNNAITITCTSATENGYAYMLKKRIALEDHGFSIHYHLHNSGEKTIVTDEYNHNFIAINQKRLGPGYVLKFPFQLHEKAFDEAVNPKNTLAVGKHSFQFRTPVEEQFFFSNLTGKKSVGAEWELMDTDCDIGIRETGNFATDKINLWGWKHVISPELFFRISLNPGRVTKWSRTYTFFKVN